MLNKAQKPSSIISYAMSIINHTMVIVRILDKEAISSKKKDKERSIERAKILHQRTPNLENPPHSLRIIRNDYEHFEERLDEWAVNSKSNNYIDLNVSNHGPIVSGVEDRDIFRQLEGHNLTFWNNSVNLQETVTWANMVGEKMEK